MFDMSSHPEGPFGPTAPNTDGETKEPEMDRRPSLPVPAAAMPFKLPPPRSSASSQNSSSPFMPQRLHAERLDSGIGLHPAETPPLPPRGEQLPSVSQLLAPVNQSESSPPYFAQAFGTSPSAANGRVSPLSYRYPDRGSPYQMHHLPPYDRSPAHLGVETQQQSSTLPSISHMASRPPDDESQPFVLPRVDSPAQMFRIPPIPSPSTAAAVEIRAARRDSSATAHPSFGTTPPKTQVRPHVVDERYIDGEGLCYIYADGSHVPKAIDGMPVNANWGVTKAGKPRKRLAQACLTCREKKIKCQPNLPKCDQCSKSGRECRFENAPRGNRAMWKVSQSSTQSGRSDGRDGNLATSYETVGSVGSPHGIPRASESSASFAAAPAQSPVSEISMLAASNVESLHESGADTESPHRATSRSSIAGDDLPRQFRDSVALYTAPDYSDILTDIKDIDPADPLASNWTTDPIDADAEVTIYLVECYFDHVNDALYHMFPRERFLSWLRSCRTKSLDDKMLLYAMITMGSIFSDRPDRLLAMKASSRTARYAVEHSQHTLSLQLAQSRIILGLWYFAIGDLVKSWDSIGAAVRTVCGLRYNIETGGVIVEQTQICEYGLHPQALIECRRRAFWAAFLLDRLSSTYSPSPVSFLPSQTALLRLPCREDLYEAQQYATVPYFQAFYNQTLFNAEGDLSALSASAFLIEIVSLWGDVSQHVFRSPHIPAEMYSKVSEELHATVMRRSEDWLRNLPPNLAFTLENLKKSVSDGKTDSFFSIHLLYHATLMKLNRYVRSQYFTAGTASQCVHRARHHAVEILRINAALARLVDERASSRSAAAAAATAAPGAPTTGPAVLKTTLVDPFLGYVILSAVDVLSAAGLISDIRECIPLIEAGIETVKDLSYFWRTSIALANLMETRLQRLVECLQDPHSAMESKVAFAVDGPPLNSRVRVGISKQDPQGELALIEDLLYGGLPRERLFAILGVDESSLSPDRILWVRDQE